MNAQEFVMLQLEWLQDRYEVAQDTETRERLIAVIEDVVIATLGESVFPGFDGKK